jgi:hypothetical protein
MTWKGGAFVIVAAEIILRAVQNPVHAEPILRIDGTEPSFTLTSPEPHDPTTVFLTFSEAPPAVATEFNNAPVGPFPALIMNFVLGRTGTPVGALGPGGPLFDSGYIQSMYSKT